MALEEAFKVRDSPKLTIGLLKKLWRKVDEARKKPDCFVVNGKAYSSIREIYLKQGSWRWYE